MGFDRSPPFAVNCRSQRCLNYRLSIYEIQKSHNISIVASLLVYPQGVTAMFGSLMVTVC